MKPHEKILQLLGMVGKDERDTLDEIDARFWCWINGFEFKNMLPLPDCGMFLGHFSYHDEDAKMKERTLSPSTQYTRSIDAQDTVKLENKYQLRVMVRKHGTCSSFVHENFHACPDLPTEAISRLHTLVQIIADERDL